MKKGFFDNHSQVSPREKIETLVTRAAIDSALRFRTSGRLALISGAGISGLAASFELLARGYKVCIVEKRNAFSRFNVINLDVETQRFLKKFGLLDEFEKTVPGRLESHQYVLVEASGMKSIGISDVRHLQHGSQDLEPKFFNDLFKEDGIYSVRIKDLQVFLARKALERGVHILGNTEIESFTCTRTNDVSEVKLIGGQVCNPNFIFLAEGARSTTANRFKLKTKELENECTGENWIFGNVEYLGEKNFVVALIDISGKSLEVANVIFNAKIKEINIAVTSKRDLSKRDIQERLLATVNRVCSFLDIDQPPQSLISAVERPVHITNEQRIRYSAGNVFCIGDTAGHSSPLAGVGGTLGMTLVPRTVENMINDFERQPENTHNNFHTYTEGYTSRWIEKSKGIKQFCLGFFRSKEQASNDHMKTSDEANLKREGPK